MLDTALLHPNASFALDVADKAIKAAAVLLGGIWTYWNYRKSRIYEKKLDLQLTGNIQIVEAIYIDILATVQNVGASGHANMGSQTYCTISAVLRDLSESPVHIFRVNVPSGTLEPGESFNTAMFWVISEPTDVVWLKLSLRTVDGELEWNTTSILRVKYEEEQRWRALRQ